MSLFAGFPREKPRIWQLAGRTLVRLFRTQTKDGAAFSRLKSLIEHTVLATLSPNSRPVRPMPTENSGRKPLVSTRKISLTIRYSRIANSGVTKPQDILVALKICLSGLERTFAVLAQELGMSASEVHASCSRLIEARLLDPDTRTIRRAALLEFLRFGVPYAFPAQLGGVTRGIPTAWACPVMAGKTVGNEDMVPVWPDPDGTHRGAAVDPLYRSVPAAARNDPALYDLLALVDALRIGRARERKLAEDELKLRLSHEPAVTTGTSSNG